MRSIEVKTQTPLGQWKAHTVNVLGPEDATVSRDLLNLRWLELREKIDWLYTHVVPRVCLVCGDTFTTFQLHHGIVSRKTVQGWPLSLRCIIDTEVNLIPLHETCHLSFPPTRDGCWERQCQIYGEDVVRDWYNSLPWKTKRPPRVFG